MDDDRIVRLESAVEDLSRRVWSLEGRAVVPGADTPAEAASAAEDAAEPAGEGGWMTGTPAWLGRTLLVLGGAFLLRAITTSGALVDALGVAAGLAYAAAWAWAADRAAARGRPTDAAFHGIAAALIAFPLVAEAATRFSVLSPALAAILVAAIGGVLLGIAWRRSLPVLAWVAAGALLATAAGLMWATRSFEPFAAVLAVAAVALTTAAWHREWGGLAWLPAGAVDVVALLAAWLPGRRGQDWLDAGAVAAFQLVVAAAYLAAITVRTLVRRREAGALEAVQSGVAVILAFEVARRLLGGGDAADAAFGITALALSAGALVAVLTRLDYPGASALTVAGYTAFAAVLATEGLRLILPLPVAGIGLAALAAGFAYAGTWPHQAPLRVSAGVLAVVAAGASGLLPASIAALAPLPGGVEPAGFEAWLAMGFLAATYVTLRRCAGTSRCDWTWTLPGLLAGSQVLLGIGGAAALVLAPSVAGEDAAATAVLRTAVLAALAVGSALLGRSRLRVEWAWLTWALLLLAGSKIVVEDLPRGRPMTLFLTLAFYGVALMVAPRLVRRPRLAA